MKKSLPALLLSILCLSCKEAAPTPNKTELLTGKTWKWVGGTISPAYDIFGIGLPVGDDYFAKAPQCWRDDLWIFSAAHNFRQEEGATKCNIGDSQVYIQGTWVFESDENVIRINKDGNGEFLWDVTELTATSLKITETFKDDGKTYTFRYSFGH